MAGNVTYEVLALRYGIFDGLFQYQNFMMPDDHAAPDPIDFFVFAIRGNGRTIVMDTGFNPASAKRRGRELLRTPAQALKDALYGSKASDPLTTFAAYLFTHNAQVALFAFALGFAFAVPTALLLVYNGLTLGALVEIYVAKGLGAMLGGWLIIHGSTELFAITLAGAAGFRIGLAVGFPGRVGRLESAVVAGRTGGTAMAGVVLMLVVAGLLEGIGRQTIEVDWERYAIGGSVFVGWLVYYYLPRKRHGLA